MKAIKGTSQSLYQIGDDFVSLLLDREVEKIKPRRVVERHFIFIINL